MYRAQYWSSKLTLKAAKELLADGIRGVSIRPDLCYPDPRFLPYGKLGRVCPHFRMEMAITYGRETAGDP